MLEEILSHLPAQMKDPALMVGLETKDDAIVYRLDDDRAIVATTDFFMPVVDDPFDFGAIAAANALSDVYAVGARPLFALALAGMPAGKLPVKTISSILAGGADMCRRAGIVVGGGHSIDAPEPIYGLAVVGLVHPDHVLRNSTARAGDVLILGKPLGVGILSAAFKKDRLSGRDYDAMMAVTTHLNSIGAELGRTPGVHAMTDVTGFGLMGHLSEMCAGSNLQAHVRYGAVPMMGSACLLAKEGIKTGAGTRNFDAFGENINVTAELEDWQRNLLFDPQTSGGLLVSVAPEKAEDVLRMFLAQGYDGAAVIGDVTAGPPTITVLD